MNTQNSQRPANRRNQLAIVGIALAVVAFLGVNIFANATFKGVRLDLTQERLFTLSDGTRQVLATLDEPVRVRLYFTKRLGELNASHLSYFNRVKELLEQYAAISKGLVQLELFNPEPFTDDEDRAAAFGLQGVPYTNTGDLGYFGIAATNSTDDLETIAYLTPEREQFLEYDLTRLLFNLARGERQTVGLLTRLPIAGGRPPAAQSRPWAIMNQINEFFQVTTVSVNDTKIPDDVDILLVVHPNKLSPALQYAIDQFVLGGGKVMAFVDPNSDVEVAINRGAAGVGASDFNTLLKAWGVTLVDGKVVGDLSTARRVNYSKRGEGTKVADYVIWLALGPGNFDAKDAVTGDIRQINVATAGAFEPVAGASTTVTPLVSIGPQTMRIDTESIRVNPDVGGLFRDFKPSGKTEMMAVRITGPAKTAFPDGPPKPAKATEGDDAATAEAAMAAAKKAHLSESKEPISVIAVADTDMLHDQFWADVRDLLGRQLLVPFANNADFVVNGLENLAGGSKLSALRGRGDTRKPFEMVDRIRQDAERKYRAKEQELQEKLTQARAELNKLLDREATAGQAGAKVILSEDEQKAIDKFRNQMIATRKDLRDVQHFLRRDIEALDNQLKFFNIAAIPLLLTVLTLVVMVVRRRRRRPSRLVES